LVIKYLPLQIQGWAFGLSTCAKRQTNLSKCKNPWVPHREVAENMFGAGKPSKIVRFSVACPRYLLAKIEALEQQPLEWDRLEPLNQKDWDNFDFQKPMGCKPHPQLCPGQRKRRASELMRRPMWDAFWQLLQSGGQKNDGS